jgi:hypothetical protein
MVGFVSEGMPLGMVIAVFSSIAFGVMILMLLMLPETRGRNLAEIGVEPAPQSRATAASSITS